MVTIKVPNTVFSETEKFLTPDELVIFMFLYRNRNIESKIIFSINLLGSILKLKKGNERENKSFIRDILSSLQEKDYISSNFIYMMKNDDVIYCDVRNVEEGYCGVSSDVYDDFIQEDLKKGKLKLYLYTYIHCFGEAGRRVDYEKISSMCRYFEGNKKYSVSTIFGVIDEMDGVYVYKFSGSVIDGDVKQNKNVYYTQIGFENMKTHQKQLEYKRNRIKPRGNSEVIECFLGEITVGELKDEIKKSAWQNTDAYGVFRRIEQGDYDIYRICADENVDRRFIRRCQKAIESMKCDPERFPYDWDEMERAYVESKRRFNVMV